MDGLDAASARAPRPDKRKESRLSLMEGMVTFDAAPKSVPLKRISTVPWISTVLKYQLLQNLLIQITSVS